MTVTVSGEGIETVSASSYVSVSLLREGSLLAAYDNVCIGDAGTTVGSCDGQGVFFDRAQLAAKGFVQGERATVPGTDLAFDVPVRSPPGSRTTPRATGRPSSSTSPRTRSSSR